MLRLNKFIYYTGISNSNANFLNTFFFELFNYYGIFYIFGYECKTIFLKC